MELSGLTQTQKAVRLIYKGLRANASAFRDKEYGDLLRTWEADPAFRLLVESHAAMMDLDVMDATPAQIILRPSRNDSLFRMTLPQARGTPLARTGGLFALALVAVGAAFFPNGVDLAPGAVERPQMSVEDIEEILSSLCDRIAAADDGQDPIDKGEDAVDAWRVLRAMSRFSDGEVRGGFGNRTAVLRKAIDVLVENNMLREDRAGVTASYIPTERLVVHMRSAMTHEIYNQCIQLLAFEAGDRENENA